MGEFNFGKTTTSLIIICIIAFTLQQFFDLSSLYFSRDYETKPWILITSLFLHANFLHLLYNLYALFIFGNVLEVNTNSKFTLLITITGGIVGNLLFGMVSNSSALGFSGSVYALIGAVTLLLPNLKVPLPIGFIAVPAKIWFAGPVMAFGELILSIASFDNVAHAAHLGGFVAGIILSHYYNKTYKKNASNNTAI